MELADGEMEPIPTTAKQACILCFSSSMLLYISYLSYLILTAVLYVNIDSFAPQAKRMDPIEKQGNKGLASLDRLPGDGSHVFVSADGSSTGRGCGGGGLGGDCILQLVKPGRCVPDRYVPEQMFLDAPSLGF